MFDIEKYLKNKKIPFEKRVYRSGAAAYRISSDYDIKNKNIRWCESYYWQKTREYMTYTDYEHDINYEKIFRYINDLFYIARRQYLEYGADDRTASELAKRKQYNECINLNSMNVYDRIYN